MPTYEYVCAKCGHSFEKYQSIVEKPLTTCPEDVCPKKKWAKGKVTRQISTGGGLLFKGTGFYITDYRSENYKQSAKKESGAATPAPAATSSASGGESKSAPAKTEAKPASKPKGDKA